MRSTFSKGSSYPPNCGKITTIANHVALSQHRAFLLRPGSNYPRRRASIAQRYDAILISHKRHHGRQSQPTFERSETKLVSCSSLANQSQERKRSTFLSTQPDPRPLRLRQRRHTPSPRILRLSRPSTSQRRHPSHVSRVDGRT